MIKLSFAPSFLPYLGGGKLGSVPGSGGFPGKRWPEMLNKTIINPCR